jgi:translation initiation factor 1
VAACVCTKGIARPAGDGIVRIRRESKGRGGKTVTVIDGLPLAAEALKELAGELKKKCGSGGTIKDWQLEIQGDHADFLVHELTRRGFKAKRSGG